MFGQFSIPFLNFFRRGGCSLSALFEIRTIRSRPTPFFFVNLIYQNMKCLVFIAVLVLFPAISSAMFIAPSSNVDDSEVAADPPTIPADVVALRQPSSVLSVTRCARSTSCSALMRGDCLKKNSEKFQRLKVSIQQRIMDAAARPASHVLVSRLDSSILQFIQDGNIQGLVGMAKCSICLDRISSTKLVRNYYDSNIRS